MCGQQFPPRISLKECHDSDYERREKLNEQPDPDPHAEEVLVTVGGDT